MAGTRKVLRLKNGFAFVEKGDCSRYIGNDGDAFDLTEEHQELIDRVLAEGESWPSAADPEPEPVAAKKIRKPLV